MTQIRGTLASSGLLPALVAVGWLTVTVMTALWAMVFGAFSTGFDLDGVDRDTTGHLQGMGSYSTGAVLMVFIVVAAFVRRVPSWVGGTAAVLLLLLAYLALDARADAVGLTTYGDPKQHLFDGFLPVILAPWSWLCSIIFLIASWDLGRALTRRLMSMRSEQRQPVVGRRRRST